MMINEQIITWKALLIRDSNVQGVKGLLTLQQEVASLLNSHQSMARGAVPEEQKDLDEGRVKHLSCYK